MEGKGPERGAAGWAQGHTGSFPQAIFEGLGFWPSREQAQEATDQRRLQAVPSPNPQAAPGHLHHQAPRSLTARGALSKVVCPPPASVPPPWHRWPPESRAVSPAQGLPCSPKPAAAARVGGRGCPGPTWPHFGHTQHPRAPTPCSSLAGPPILEGSVSLQKALFTTAKDLTLVTRTELHRLPSTPSPPLPCPDNLHPLPSGQPARLLATCPAQAPCPSLLVLAEQRPPGSMPSWNLWPYLATVFADGIKLRPI